jgi:hypothetical protein
MASPRADSSEPKIVFRATKKRKTYRQRGDDEADGAETTVTASSHRVAKHSADGEDDEGISVSEVLKLRNARKVRSRGLEIRADHGPRPENAEQALVLRDESSVGGQVVPVTASVPSRFAPQTGLVGEIFNKHM